jgi:carbonic anhydrase
MADIKKLIKGYRRFFKRYFKTDNSLYQNLSTQGQSPRTLIISCSDSRADPSIITDADPGDIFVVRNVANLVPPYAGDDGMLHGVSTALEFGVCYLEVKNIVVLGHSGCAGIRALLNPAELTKSSTFIGRWMDIAKDAKKRAIAKSSPEDLHTNCEKESIITSLENLLTFPWIKESVEKNGMKLYGWYFSMHDGKLEEYNQDTGVFKSIK